MDCKEQSVLHALDKSLNWINILNWKKVSKKFMLDVFKEGVEAKFGFFFD